MTIKKIAKTLFLGVGFSFLFTSAALADQCSYITKQQALAAVSRLNPGQTIYQFCELCGDTTPQSVKINSVSAGTVEGSNNYWEVRVNDQNIDLAYTYVDNNNKENRKVNLAALTQCPTQGASRFIRVNR